MVFAATLLDIDTIFLVYNVPTIGICRAEQREKACQKLGVPLPLPAPGLDGFGSASGNSTPTMKMEVDSGGRKREAQTGQV